jgi:hypothetical protein
MIQFSALFFKVANIVFCFMVNWPILRVSHNPNRDGLEATWFLSSFIDGRLAKNVFHT